MRAPPQETHATTGVSQVMADFQRIGWAPVENRSHDLGTDLLVAARDSRRFDCGLVFGVQVKSGPSWFKDEERDGEGNLVGWWFYEPSYAHFDDWVRHGLPHLVVLHDLDSRTSFWVHVTPTQCHVTAGGCSILVPAHQKIDEPNREALLEVAAQQRAAVSIEGLAFKSGAKNFAPGDRLRFALLAPRLVAPHPNAGTKTALVADEAIALVVQYRIQDLNRFLANHPNTPRPGQSFKKKDWRWKFFLALYELTTNSDLRQLRALSKSQLPSNAVAAINIVIASALIAHGAPEEAEALLSKGIRSDSFGPVDQAWTHVQRARARFEQGNAEGAREDAVLAQKELIHVSGDITASVIAGTAAWVLFNTADIGSGRLDELITASDNAVGWWRTQKAAAALDSLTNDLFREWAQDTTVTLRSEDSIRSNLLANQFNAAVSGDQPSWRHSSSQLVRYSIVEAFKLHDVDEIARSIDQLRYCGDVDTLKLSIRKTWNSGPIAALMKAGNEINLDKLSRTSLRATLVYLDEAGDTFVETKATAAAAWLIDAIFKNSQPKVAIKNSEFHFLPQAIEGLAGLLPSANRETQALVAQHLCTVSSKDSFLSGPLRNLTAAIDYVAPPPLASKIYEAGLANENASLSAELLGFAARSGNLDARRRLVLLCSTGNAFALSQIEDIRTLGDAQVSGLIAIFSTLVEEQIAQAHQGTFSLGVFDPAQILTALNINHPAKADWKQILNLLKDQKVAAYQKAAVCQQLIGSAPALGKDVASAISAIIEQIDSAKPLTLLGTDSNLSSLSSAIRVLFGNLNTSEKEGLIIDLLMGTSGDRSQAALLIGLGSAPSLYAALPGLLADKDLVVRAATSAAVGRLIRDEVDTPSIRASVAKISADEGARMQVALLSALGEVSDLPEWARSITESLQESPSSTIRKLARRAASR